MTALKQGHDQNEMVAKKKPAALGSMDEILLGTCLLSEIVT